MWIKTNKFKKIQIENRKKKKILKNILKLKKKISNSAKQQKLPINSFTTTLTKNFDSKIQSGKIYI